MRFCHRYLFFTNGAGIKSPKMHDKPLEFKTVFETPIEPAAEMPIELAAEMPIEPAIEMLVLRP